MRRAWLRKARYWVSHALLYRGRLLTEPWVHRQVIERLASHTTFEGIKIVAPLVGKGESPPMFLEDMVAALRLIQSVDPRRFRRVQREIVSVEDAPGLFTASYRRLLKRCSIDYARFDPEKRGQHPEWYTWLFAASLVHEATHGAIYSRHIQYTPKLRERIERLCWTEGRRFAIHADAGGRQWSETLVPPLNVEWYRAAWRLTRWQRARQLLARYRDAWRALKAKG